MIEQAMMIATSAHRGQKRWDGVEEFINHPKRIAKALKARGACDIEVAAAWLHDVVEDTQVSIDTLRELDVDARVVELVRLLTHSPNESYVEYILHMVGPDRSAVGYKTIAARIKSLDIIDNITSTDKDKMSDSMRDKYELAYYLLTGAVLR